MGIICNQQKSKHTRLYLDPRSKGFARLAEGDSSSLPSIFVRTSEYHSLLEEYEEAGRVWRDETFPPNENSLGKIEELKSQPQWKRILDISKDPVFMVDGFDSTDIIRGTQQNYILSAATVVAQHPQRIARLFPPIKGVNKSGIYMVRLMLNGMVEEIVVDDWVPTTSSGVPIFSQLNQRQFWPLILEKAIAKSQGSYESILFGSTALVLGAMTFSPVVQMLVDPQSSDNLHSVLQQALARKFIVCGTSHDQPSDQTIPSNRTFAILRQNHDRSLLVRASNLDPTSQQQMQTLDCSDRKQNLEDNHNLAKHEKPKKGLFTIAWSDFLWKFSSIDIAQVDQSYTQTPVQYACNCKQAKYFSITVKNQSPLRLTATLKSAKKANNKNAERIRIVLARVLDEQKHELDYVGSISQRSMSATLEVKNVTPGRYVVYTKIQKSGEAVLMTELYSQVPEVQQLPKPACSGFLNRVFMSHAIKHAEKQYLNPQKTDWVVSKLLVKEAGLGYIACSIASSRLQLDCSEYVFESEGFRVKSPYRGLDKIKVTAEKGQQAILIAKIKRGAKFAEASFPPELKLFYSS